MKICIVTGSRSIVESEVVDTELAAIDPDVVIQGGCLKGADLHALNWARENDRTSVTVNANWLHGGTMHRNAGIIRNDRMITLFHELLVSDDNEVIVLAFPRGGGGTEDCMKRAKEIGFNVIVR